MTNKKIKYQPVPPEITKLVSEHGDDPETLLEVLVDLETHPTGLSPDTVTEAARALKVPPHKAYGMATFYSMLSFEERKKVMRVCDGPVCWLKRATEDRGSETENSVIGHWSSGMPDDWTVERSSCLGLCDRAPAALVEDEQAGPIAPEEATKVCEGWRGVPTDYSQPRDGEVRVMMANADKIDPDSIDSALEYGAYDGLKSVLQRTPEKVLDLVEDSGLQGRGGAGFPVGRKWKFVAGAKGTPKYIICNADESEPLIFKDRVLIDTNPHQLLEGMLIGGYGCGASEAWIYIRGEYEYQAQRLERAIRQAEEKGYLGENILDSGFSFKIHVHRGAGAYICGEETALIESLEGKRGEPRLRPPYPPSYGFRGQPTAVNNVESFAAVPHIAKNGADWWKSLSDYDTPGTKMYMILGHVKNPGLFEAPFGLSLRQLIDDFGGGMLEGSEFKFALCGGAAGTIVDKDFLDIPIDFASSQKGISLGAGSFMVCDQSVSPVAFLRELLHFFAVESCGKCTPCRVGTHRAHDILSRMTEGKGREGDIAELKALSDNMLLASFCGLGQSVPISMNSVMNLFAKAFEEAEI
ncbi:MAG: NADH-ubiquinone oxidoreductase-F iron-sulfur binding region domain-containing protein [Anaerolineales bacterium]|jgi:NADH-quinone oxidoreductase subunit F